MSLIDWIPVVSQLKSLVQLVDGNTEGAKRTQMNFLRECPGVSYLTNIVQLAAMETKKRCIRTVNNVLNSIPFIGHLKGHRHHVTGNYNGRNQAWTAATRSIVVLCCYSVAADAESEGNYAIFLAIVAGAISDIVASLISWEVQGIVAAVLNADDNLSAGAIFDLFAILVAGYCVCVTLELPGISRQEYFPALFVYTFNSLASFLIAILRKNNRRRKRKDKEYDKQQKLKRMEELDKQKPQGYLRDKYPDSSRLYLIMPKEFPYTVVNQLNNERHGIYHSFIRHINQWREVISFDNYDVQTAFLEIQMSLHRFIQENMTSNNYLGRTINDNDHEQLYFKVITRQRKPKVMVVCISDQLYKPETTLPIRTLVTVFFKS